MNSVVGWEERLILKITEESSYWKKLDQFEQDVKYYCASKTRWMYVDWTEKLQLPVMYCSTENFFIFLN